MRESKTVEIEGRDVEVTIDGDTVTAEFSEHPLDYDRHELDWVDMEMRVNGRHVELWRGDSPVLYIDRKQNVDKWALEDFPLSSVPSGLTEEIEECGFFFTDE